MKTFRLRFLARVIFIGVAISLFAISACKKDDDDEPTMIQKEAPELPPESSFVMDFSNFNDTTNNVLRFGTPEADTTKWNHFRAAVYVGVWNLVLIGNLAIPVASFKEAFNHEPTQISDNPFQWEWKYNFRVSGILHTARLVGTLASADEVTWKMYVTKEGEYADFLWYEGSHNIERTLGTWDLFYGPTNPVQYLDIEWSRDYTNATWDIKYIHVDETHANYGGYIHHGREISTEEYDAFYYINHVQDTNYLEIEWNSVDKHGRIMNEKFYGTQNWQCWDAEFYDSDCN